MPFPTLNPALARALADQGYHEPTPVQAAVLEAQAAEADQRPALAFREDLEFILEATPAGRRTLLFSATIPAEIAALARHYQRRALRISTAGRDEPHGDIEYRAMRVAPGEVEHAVVNV